MGKLNFEKMFKSSKYVLMEGAVGERLKREFNIRIDENLALANLIYDKYSRKALESIYQQYIDIAKKYDLPLMITTPTRRANYERVKKSSYSENIILDNVDFLKNLREKSKLDFWIGGLMGCKGDAYQGTDILSEKESLEFHFWQADLFQKSRVDFLYAGIMPSVSESIGMAQAMEKTQLSYIISFMIRNNGRLIDNSTLHDAIEQIDGKTVKKPICYMVNCVHPEILKQTLNFEFNKKLRVSKRLLGIQANTSNLPPQELDHSLDLMTTDCLSLANDIFDLNQNFKPKIIGGCCGTDHTHIEEIAKRLKQRLKSE